MRILHRLLAGTGAAAVLLAGAACNSAPSATQPPSAAAPAPNAAPAPGSEGTNPGQKVVTAIFGNDDAATTYNQQLVPNGAKVLVAEYVFADATTVTLNVRGLVPNRAYGAHAHAKPCGPKPDDAGSHFQHNADPVKPSVNPAFANPSNEIWLDFTTDGQGNSTKATTVPWVFSANRAASVVIHAMSTQTGPGEAGVAGARLACLSVGF